MVVSLLFASARRRPIAGGLTDSRKRTQRAPRGRRLAIATDSPSTSPASLRLERPSRGLLVVRGCANAQTRNPVQRSLTDAAARQVTRGMRRLGFTTFGRTPTLDEDQVLVRGLA